MKKYGNIVIMECILLLLALTAGLAAADDGNVTDNITDNVTDSVVDNATDTAMDNVTDNATTTEEDDTEDGTDEGMDEQEEEELSDDIEPYDGSFGPGNALYGLKIAFEKVDIAFTFNESEKLGKQVSLARLRIAEAKSELRKNNTDAANKALELYGEQIESANRTAAGFDKNDLGIFNAQKNIIKHQYVLERLLEANPNNTGLQRAYNNSLRLEEKFELKTERKLERIVTKDERVQLKTVRKEKLPEINETEAELKEERQEKIDEIKENARETKEELEDKKAEIKDKREENRIGNGNISD